MQQFIQDEQYIKMFSRERLGPCLVPLASLPPVSPQPCWMCFIYLLTPAVDEYMNI